MHWDLSDHPGKVAGTINPFQPGPGDYLLPPSQLPGRAITGAGSFYRGVASCGIWPALQQCGAGAFLESTMRTRFTRLRGDRGQAAYEPRSLAEWKEEERQLAEAAAQRRQQQATNPTNPPPGGFVVSGDPKCNE